MFGDFPTFSRICIFFLLTLSLLSSSLFYSSHLSDSSHLCFSSVHNVGSLTSKFPSIIKIDYRSDRYIFGEQGVIMPLKCSQAQSLNWSGTTQCHAHRHPKRFQLCVEGRRMLLVNRLWSRLVTTSGHMAPHPPLWGAYFWTFRSHFATFVPFRALYFLSTDSFI